MILLCGVPSEAPLRLAIEAARVRSIPAVIFNQRQTAQIEIEYSLARPPQTNPQNENRPAPSRLAVTGILRISDGVYPLEDFSGVYLRLMDYQELPEFNIPTNQPSIFNLQPSTFNLQPANRLVAVHRTLIDWTEIAGLRVMNRLSAMGSNQSKPYQAQLIAHAGFLIPPTLVTNDPELARDFLKTHGRLVYKSTSAVRSVVQELDRPRLAELEKIRYLPTQFQAYIPGENLRVHVAGDRVFATRICTGAVDYRYAGQSGEPASLEAMDIDDELAERCRRLARQLDLPLCGIDLKRTPAAEIYCFEANPSPAYSFYQEQTGQDIAGALVNYLEYGIL